MTLIPCFQAMDFTMRTYLEIEIFLQSPRHTDFSGSFLSRVRINYYRLPFLFTAAAAVF